MTNKIALAIEYTRTHTTATSGNTIEDVKNDAANIFADNYDEYCEIWKALEKI